MIDEMKAGTKTYILRIVKTVGILLTVVLSLVMIYAAYCGTTHPDDSKIAPLAVLAFPFLLAIEVAVGLAWESVMM